MKQLQKNHPTTSTLAVRVGGKVLNNHVLSKFHVWFVRNKRTTDTIFIIKTTLLPKDKAGMLLLVFR
jgi:hypothetical protein